MMSREFFDAIKEGNRDEVEHRLNLDPGLIHAKENGLSPIMVAAYHQEPAIASFLADKTVAINIFEASATGKINNVIRLLARDPQLVNAYAEDGFQPLGLACFFGHLETAEYLIKAGAPINFASRNGLKAAPIQSATAARHEKIVQMLLRLGADPNVREGNGYTPLHAAAQNKDIDMIHTLIYGGADLTLAGKDGKTPLDLAVETGDQETIGLLAEGITKRLKPKRA
ncbi:MAG TPA: ankyrin repeat domain-containing protein [Anaerolineales bacterium]|nr:ankyrin repeat domain-containing protein [Anaerolineales bacterium]